MATTFTQFGGTALSASVITKPIGGTAAAGDWLSITTGAIDGVGVTDAPVITDNVSGSTGWEKVADFTSSEGGNSFRTTTWRKRCVGGETTTDTTWPGATNIALIGFWMSTPTQPFLYVLDQGPTIFGGTYSEFDSANPPETNAESYYGVITNGRGDLTFGALLPPETGALFAPNNGFTHVLGLFNTDEGSNTVADVVGLRVQPDRVCYVVLFGIGPEAVDLAGTGQILLEGSGELVADGGAAHLRGTGAILDGSGDLETTGGSTQLAGAGETLLRGRGRLFAPQPFPPPVRIPEDHLGCGVYQCFAFTRGLREIVTMLPFTQVEYARILDETGDATLTIDGVANPRAFDRCCAALSELEPEEHELAIYRNGWRVWSGPMTDLSFPAEQCVIQASDLSWWLTVRTIHENINSVDVDLVNILVAYVQDAMSVDNSAGLTPTVLALAGQLGERLVQASDHQFASDAIAELSRTGVDWTTLDRRMLVGPLQPQPPPFPGATPYPTLIDANFRVQPTILVSGSQGANCWYVNGPTNGAGDLIFGEYGPEFAETPDHVAQPAAPDYAAIEEQFGRIEKVVTESRILDQPGIDFNAQTRYDLLKRPLVYISDGALLPSTPIPMEKLLPGSIVNVHLSNVCRIIAEPYRIKQVSVQANSDGSEAVDVQWQPLGTGVVLDGEL